MDIAEIRIKKKDLERAILCAVSRLVDDFKVATGGAPSNILIDMIPVNEIGDLNHYDYVVGGVRVDIEI